jgi:nucleoside 2-deoxyribosyltransferase
MFNVYFNITDKVAGPYKTRNLAQIELYRRAEVFGNPLSSYSIKEEGEGEPQPGPNGKVIYLIGSLRNPEVPKFANRLRAQGFEVFDDWYAAGPEADDKWMEYEKQRGHTFAEALNGHAAYHVWEYDKKHLQRADAAILLMPAGKSGHLELGYFMGLGKPGYILMEREPDRFDVMYRFTNITHTDEQSLTKALVTDLCASTAAR